MRMFAFQIQAFEVIALVPYRRIVWFLRTLKSKYACYYVAIRKPVCLFLHSVFYFCISNNITVELHTYQKKYVQLNYIQYILWPPNLIYYHHKPRGKITVITVI